jgi:Flp pilus assembly protein TadD
MTNTRQQNRITKMKKSTPNPTLEEQQQLLNLYNQGLFAEAVSGAENLISRFGNCVFAWKILGAGLQNLGQSEKAVIAKRKVVQLAPNDADALMT